MKAYKLLITLIAMITSPSVLSQPLNIDSILTKTSEWQLDTAINYNSSTSASVSSECRRQFIFNTLSIDCTNPEFILSAENNPVQANNNTDTIALNTNIRYGYSERLEVFASTGYRVISSRNTFTDNLGTPQFNRSSNTDITNINIGFSYQYKGETNTPSLILGASTNLLNRPVLFNSGGQRFSSYFDSLNVFATTFYTSDPLIFLLRSSFFVNFEQEENNTRQKIPNILTLEPSIYFSVNPYTTIQWGYRFNLQTTGSVQFGNQNRFNFTQKETSSASIFGVTHEIDNDLTVFLQVDKEDTAISSQTNIIIGFTMGF